MSKETMYPKLFTPMKLGNLTLQNRYYAAPSKPQTSQGPEDWPAEGTIRHFVNKAKQGCSLVTVFSTMSMGKPNRIRGYNPGSYAGHFSGFDIEDSTVQNYMCQFADALHFYGSKACMNLGKQLEGYDVDDGALPYVVLGDGGGAGFVNAPGKRLPESKMREIAKQLALESVILQDSGFDAIYMHAAYRLCYPGRFLSLRTNTRDDEFGGSVENRSRYLFMLCDAIKERCGKDFPLIVSITGEDLEDPDPAKHWTLEDTKEFVKLADGHIDMIQMRGHCVDYQHNMGFEPKLPYIDACRAAKSVAKNVLISSTNGYYLPSMCEEALEEGYADCIGIARALISNPEWGKKAMENREEDIVPCIKCNKCHRNTFRKSHQAVCSVNPEYGIEHRVDYLKVPAERPLNLAVVGGGPAGMRAAMFATEAGHRVTLFEKTDKLGGRLDINEFVDFKWPIWDYCKWLSDKTLKNPNIEIRFNTEATQELLQKGNFDEILVAIGADPVKPRIPGIDGKNVFHAADVYGHPELCGDKVVVIGGGDIGVETGFYLNELGKKVFVIEMKDELMLDATPIHYRARFIDEWNKWKEKGLFDWACSATCTGITDKGVTYTDKDGKEHLVEADTVIYSVGMREREKEALGMYWAGKRIHLMGDCREAGSIQTCNRDAYRTVNTLFLQ